MQTSVVLCKEEGFNKRKKLIIVLEDFSVLLVNNLYIILQFDSETKQTIGSIRGLG